ncbi:MAG: MFS transporter [Deltaproteobacteria bacterium]|nr:MFS transporter [Deltaproteobacteria bacterium]MBW2395234.1 MFS transporter [Deltaproteobacteria bacterium]
MAAAPHKASLAILFSVVIVDLIGFGIVMPVLPYWASDFGADGWTYGLIQSSYALAQFVFAPLWGRLSDRLGRRPVMLVTILGTAISLAWLGFAESLAGLFAARILAGGFAANIGVASAYITDVTSDEDRTRWMGMLGASFGVGFTLGPAIGGVLAPYGYPVPMLAAAGLAALNFVFAMFALRDPPHRSSPERTMGRLEVLRNPRVRHACIIYLFFSLAVTQLENMFPLYMKDAFHLDARSLGFLLVGMALVMGGVQGGGMRALAERYSERSLVMVGSAILAIGFLFLPLAPGIGWLLLPLTFSAVGRAISQPSLMSLTSFEASPEARGAVMTTFQSMASLARIFGPAAAGFLFDRNMAWPFWLAAALMVVVLVQSRGLRPGRLGDAEATAA